MRKNLDYTEYTVEDFCQDKSFQEWVKMQDAKSISFWESWVKENQEHLDEINNARAIILSLGIEKENVSANRVNLLKAKIDEKIAPPQPTHIERKSYTFAKVAAAISILAITSVIFFWFSPENINNDQNLVETINTIEKSNKAGEKTIFILSDSTRITLNANSKLSFPEKFSDNKRQVQLEGEAFFEVTKDTSRPFTIKSGEVITTVLGTSFNINAYPTSRIIKVAVATGKVSVKGFDGNIAKDEWTILPNEMTIFQKDSHSMRKTSFNSLGEMGWKDGIIYFKDDGIDKIIATLSQWYGADFTINKKIEKTTDYSGIYDNKSLEEVLKGISFVFDFNYEIKGKSVIIN